MMMTGLDIDGLEKTAARLGDVVIDPQLWPDILHQISRAVGAAGALLLQTDVRTPDVPRSEDVSELVSEYFEQGWHRRDVRALRGVPRLLTGQAVVIDQDILTADEMRRDPGYQELFNRMGFQWFAAVGFRAGSAPWVLSIQRALREGAFDEHHRLVLTALSQRLTQVATLSTVVGREALFGITNALDRVPQPALALDRMGFVVGSNPSAERLFGPDLRLDGLRRLIIADPLARSQFDQYRDRLRLIPDTSAIPMSMIVIRRDGHPRFILRMLPIDGPARGPFFGARVLLLISDLSKQRVAAPDVLRKVFGLTPAEARISAKLAAGESLEQIAEQFKISKETARNHLKSIFLKTSVRRQSELASLLGRLSAP